MAHKTALQAKELLLMIILVPISTLDIMTQATAYIGKAEQTRPASPALPAAPTGSRLSTTTRTAPRPSITSWDRSNGRADLPRQGSPFLPPLTVVGKAESQAPRVTGVADLS